MKKALIVAAVLCCVSFFANAQIQDLIINNYTSGNVHVQLSGDVAGTTCSARLSGIITIGPGSGSLVAGAIPGLVAGDEIALIKVMSDEFGGAAGLGCTPYAEFLMSPCPSFGSAVTTHGPFTFYDGMSMGCTSNTATSITLTMPSPSVAILTFN